MRSQGFAVMYTSARARCYASHVGLQILRVVPYSATQLYSYELLKKRFQNEKGEMSIPTRLACGGLAGMIATLVSHLLTPVFASANHWS